MPGPKISFVSYGRNDGYRENFEAYFAVAVQHMAEKAAEYSLNLEHIIIDWNSPPDRPTLFEAFQPLTSNANCVTRVISVPKGVHNGLRHAQELPMLAANAVNLGIFRATGDVVATKAADTLFSDAFYRFLAETELSETCVYRCDRVDFRPTNADGVPTLEDLLEAASHEENVVMINQTLEDALTADYFIPPAHTNACGDFTMMASEMWHRIRGLDAEIPPPFLNVDGLVLYAALAHGLTEVVMPPEAVALKPVHGAMNAARTTERRTMRMEQFSSWLYGRFSRRVATLVLGLIDYPKREDWRTSRAYPSHHRAFGLRAGLWFQLVKLGIKPRFNNRDWGAPKAVGIEEKVL